MMELKSDEYVKAQNNIKFQSDFEDELKQCIGGLKNKSHNRRVRNAIAFMSMGFALILSFIFWGLSSQNDNSDADASSDIVSLDDEYNSLDLINGDITNYNDDLITITGDKASINVGNPTALMSSDQIVASFIVYDFNNNDEKIYDGDIARISYVAKTGVYGVYAIMEGGESINISKYAEVVHISEDSGNSGFMLLDQKNAEGD